MAKLKKHSEILDQIHSLVRKQAEEAQKVQGVPSTDTHPAGPDAKSDTIDKNKVTPQDNKNEFDQKPSVENAGAVVSANGVKSASVEELTALKDNILNLLKKAEDAQASVAGKPGEDTKPAGPGQDTNHIDKNKVTPQDNVSEIKQKPSVEDAGKVVNDASVKSATEDEKLAAKIAAYNTGAALVHDLLKSAGFAQEKTAEERQFLKEAGRNDMDILISQVAEQLSKQAKPNYTNTQTSKVASDDTSAYEYAEKEAEAAGAAYFDEIYKQASDAALIEKVSELEAKLAEVTKVQSAEEKAKSDQLAKQAQEKWEADLVEKIASKSAELAAERIKSNLKSEVVPK